MSLRYFNSNLPEQKVFGITGGADDMDRNYGQILRVNYFLRLQPQRWHVANELITPTQRRVLPHLESKSPRISLPSLSDLPEHLEELRRVSPRGAELATGLQALFSLNLQTHHLMPIYGVGNHGVARLALVIRSLERMQRHLC